MEASKRGVANWPIRTFGRWWTVKFVPAMAAMRRKHEFQADADAARLTSAAQLADALCRMQVVAESVAQHDYEGATRDTFLDAVRQRHARILSTVGSRISGDLAGDALARALQWQGDQSESHPTLTDRLRALNVDATDRFAELLSRATEPRVPSAADTLLRKSSRDALEDYLGALTRQHPHLLQPLTEEEKRAARVASAAISNLESRLLEGRLDADGKAELVRRRHDAGRTADAEQLAREVLASAPDALTGRRCGARSAAPSISIDLECS
jgi:hypothetical protein